MGHRQNHHPGFRRALLATIGIDLGLLALAIVNPPREPPPIRLSGMLQRQISDAIRTAIASVEPTGVDKDWVRRHFVHHNLHSYFVIPNLYSCNGDDKTEAIRGVAMNQLAGVLGDLGLVHWPDKGRKIGPITMKKSELEKLKDEEAQGSTTDLTEIRKKWAQENGLTGEDAKTYTERHAIRNHGLFSKAERALQIAGWSDKARADVEIFRIVKMDGLTPLLMVLDEGGTSAPSGAPDAPGPRP